MTKASASQKLIMQKDEYGNVFYDTYLHEGCRFIKEVESFFNKEEQ